MWDQIIQVLIALPVTAVLLFLLVPRHAAHTWAIWLVICQIAVSVQGIGQGVFNYYNPQKLYLFTKDNELRFLKDQANELVGVVINYPPEGFAASRIPEQPVPLATSSLLLACAILLLLLRAEPAGLSSAGAAQSAGRKTGISLQAFGLVVLLVSMVEAITSRSGTLNLVGMVVIASGFYVSRGSQLAAKWALALTALISGLLLLVVAVVASGDKPMSFMGRTLQPGEAPWAITIGLAITAWAAINMFLTARLLMQSDNAVEPTGEADGGDTGY